MSGGNSTEQWSYTVRAGNTSTNHDGCKLEYRLRTVIKSGGGSAFIEEPQHPADYPASPSRLLQLAGSAPKGAPPIAIGKRHHLGELDQTGCRPSGDEPRLATGLSHVSRIAFLVQASRRSRIAALAPHLSGAGSRRQVFLFLARRDPRRSYGSADYVSGSLLALWSFRHRFSTSQLSDGACPASTAC